MGENRFSRLFLARQLAGCGYLIAHPPQSLGKALTRVIPSQLIRHFAADLPKTSNYPCYAGAFVEWCLNEGLAINRLNFTRYTIQLPPSRISTIPKFILFYQTIGSPLIIADFETFCQNITCPD